MDKINDLVSRRKYLKRRAMNKRLGALSSTGASYLLGKGIDKGGNLSGTSDDMRKKVNKLYGFDIKGGTISKRSGSYYHPLLNSIHTDKGASVVAAHELGHAINRNKRSDRRRKAAIIGISASNLLTMTPVVGMVSGNVVGRKMAKDRLAGKKTPKYIRYLPEVAQTIVQVPQLREEAKANIKGYHIARNWGGRKKVKKRDILPTLGRSFGSYVGVLGTNVLSSSAAKSSAEAAYLNKEIKRLKKEKRKEARRKKIESEPTKK